METVANVGSSDIQYMGKYVYFLFLCRIFVTVYHEHRGSGSREEKDKIRLKNLVINSL